MTHIFTNKLIGSFILWSLGYDIMKSGRWEHLEECLHQDILEMNAVCSTETLVPIFQITNCQSKQESNVNPHCHESLKYYCLTCSSTLSTNS
jgi:hypothetical protein